MKGNRMYVDIGSMLDEIFDAAKEIGDQVRDSFGPGRPHGPWFHPEQDDNADWYPTYSYPPMNIFMTADRSMVFEFALAGFDEKDISLTFQGDYMVFAARIDFENVSEEGVRYFKRRLKLKDIERQKYYVPADKFSQSEVKASFKNGILRVTIPPKAEQDAPEGVKIEIVKEGD
ncbi:MAG: Hsp20/alpha crystallin family protein [Spirochaetales bacterium]|nr:Hsp20/alpha crystallin family protein [Spirochaetales bacterium]MBP7263167.1 Hsp20/alpha crystallin family protein [Spirochaetia bacterium]